MSIVVIVLEYFVEGKEYDLCSLMLGVSKVVGGLNLCFSPFSSSTLNLSLPQVGNSSTASGRAGIRGRRCVGRAW